MDRVCAHDQYETRDLLRLHLGTSSIEDAVQGWPRSHAARQRVLQEALAVCDLDRLYHYPLFRSTQSGDDAKNEPSLDAVSADSDTMATSGYAALLTMEAAHNVRVARALVAHVLCQLDAGVCDTAVVYFDARNMWKAKRMNASPIDSGSAPLKVPGRRPSRPLCPWRRSTPESNVPTSLAVQLGTVSETDPENAQYGTRIAWTVCRNGRCTRYETLHGVLYHTSRCLGRGICGPVGTATYFFRHGHPLFIDHAPAFVRRGSRPAGKGRQRPVPFVARDWQTLCADLLLVHASAPTAPDVGRAQRDERVWGLAALLLHMGDMRTTTTTKNAHTHWNAVRPRLIALLDDHNPSLRASISRSH